MQDVPEPMPSLAEKVRSLVHIAIPSHLHDPFGLARRVWREGGAEGRFAMLLAGLGIMATPVDLLLKLFEERLYRAAEPPSRPMVFVCGAARSGTTVVAQTLARALPVSYFTNLTSIFPRAPIMAGRLLGVQPRSGVVTSSSHYGRTSGFSAPNDGLYLWDRWLKSDRTEIAESLSSRSTDRMIRFFGAYEAWTDRPLVTKNNALNAHASLVGRHLPTARFICLDRDPVYLAQSLLVARNYIHDDPRVPYGLDSPGDHEDDPVASVCGQVRFHRDLAQRQVDALGPDRFVVQSYEAFCSKPSGVVERVAAWLGVDADVSAIPRQLVARRSRTVPPETFARIERELSV